MHFLFFQKIKNKKILLKFYRDRKKILPPPDITFLVTPKKVILCSKKLYKSYIII